MKSLLLAAGLGTRLRPLTNDRPKALVEVNHKTLLEHALEKLMESGVTEVIINVHHFSEMMKRFIASLHYSGLRIEVSDESDALLDTGGAIKRAAWFFEDGQPFVVYNVDIFTDLDLRAMLRYHNEQRAMVTLAVSQRTTSRYLLFDSSQRLQGWRNEKSEEVILADGVLEEALNPLAFSGIHIISPEFLSLLPSAAAFPIIPEYIAHCRHCPIFGFNHTGTRWLDVGKLDALQEAEDF